MREWWPFFPAIYPQFAGAKKKYIKFFPGIVYTDNEIYERRHAID